MTVAEAASPVVLAHGPAARADAIAALVARLDGAGADVLFDEVVRAAEAFGDATLFRGAMGDPISGTAFARRLAGLPTALAARGMQRGDVALVGVRPGVDAILYVLAAMRLGVVTTIIDPGAGLELFNRRIELMRPQWVVAESVLYLASARTPLRPYLRRRGMELPRLGSIPGSHLRVGHWLPGVPRGATDWAQVVAAAGALVDPSPVELPAPSDPAIVFFTSGTTGHPKGVQHTGRSVTAALRLMIEQFDLPAGSTFYNHNLHTFLAATLLGVPTVVAHLQMEPGRWRREADEAGATHAFLRPVDAFRVVRHCEETGAPFPQSLRQVILYSAPVTRTILERIHAVGHPDLVVTCVYAMTEAAPVASVDSRERIAWEEEGDLVGRPSHGVEVRISETGELLLRGDNVHAGYVGMEPTEWHATGDQARLREDGSIVLLGRVKDMLIRGEFNLYPGLYEDTICRIPGVHACAIVGVPDAETADESVVLYVEPSPDIEVGDPTTFAERVAKALRTGDTRIDHNALPDWITVVDALPRAGRARKVDRATLRTMAAAEAATQ